MGTQVSTRFTNLIVPNMFATIWIGGWDVHNAQSIQSFIGDSDILCWLRPNTTMG